MNLEQRNRQLRDLLSTLPGSVPYDNIRPLNVPQAFDAVQVIELLSTMHNHVPTDYWSKECELGLIRHQGKPLSEKSIVRAGWRIEHIFPDTTEPDVSADIELMFEDEHLLTVNKPAPLPMHPCGRFNRNTLIEMLNLVFEPGLLRLVHRLDANTSGIVIIAKTKEATRELAPQFSTNQVSKEYLALVSGHPEAKRFECKLAIGRDKTRSGGRVPDDSSGRPSHTSFEVMETLNDQTLLRCIPHTGRTNQIRIHLASLGLPIVGDTVYCNLDELKSTDSQDEFMGGRLQTLGVNDQPLCLQSSRIRFAHPATGETLELSAPAPSWARQP
ncbi:MAG: RluA family pseudouridine synthase [Pirellulaceae bacterium]